MSPAEARAALAPLVDHRADVVAALGDVLTQHRACKGLTTPFDVPSRDYVRRRRAAARLSQALDQLQHALHKAPEDLIQALAGAAPHLRSGSLNAWAGDLYTLWAEASYLRGIQQGRRGAPVNLSRRRLEDATARVLARADMRLTKARSGRLARVLVVMYAAAGEPGPDDLFPVLSRLCPGAR